MKNANSGKKSLLWLWITIGLVVALVVAGVLCYTLGVFEGSKQEKKFTSKLYWNLDREAMMDVESGLSAREAAEDGMYYVRFAVGGEVVELPVADGKLVNRIDIKEVMCLKFDADGVIIDVVDAEEVYTKISEKVFVQSVNGNAVLANSSQALNGMQTTVTLNENTGIYNVTDKTEKPGYPGALEPMDQIVVYGTDENTPTDVFIVGRYWYSEVYWRVSARRYDTVNKRTSRERADDGYWYMDWAVNGEIVTLRTDRQDVANAWDGYGVNDACCGMVFNAEGDVIDCFNAALAARGTKAANSYDVTEMAEDGSSFTATRILFGTEVGKTYTSIIDENTKIFNVNSTADQIGEFTELQLTDRVLVITDSMGKAKIIYVINRMVDSPMYYNVSRNWSSGLNQTQRTPDADGWYHIKLAVKGREVTYRTRNRDLVNQIDAYSMSLFGLKVEGDIIVKAYDAVCVTGNYSFAANNFVDSIDGVLLATSNTAGTAANGVLAENCEIYDVSGHGKFKGVATTIREGDRVICYQNALGEVTHVYIINRHEKGSVLYWNVNRYYAGGQSTRGDQKFDGKPLLDEDGYYNFRVIKVGTTDVTWVKTKDKSIVDRMDSYGTPTAFSLYVNSAGVVSGAYPCNAALGGYQAANYLHIDRVVNEDERSYKIQSYRTGATGTIFLAEDVAVYDYTADSVLKGSDVPEGATIKGSRTSLRVGDKVSCIANREGKIAIIFVVERETSGTQLAVRKSGNANKADENGYYVFELIINGQVKVLKTKDQALAKKITGYGYAFAVKYKGDIITGAYTATASTDVYEQAAGAYYDVERISGGKLYLKRNRVGQSDTGKTANVDLAYGYKAYVIDPHSPNFGKLVTLKKGDRVYGYTDYNAQLKYIFVAYECTREGGNMGYCDHCGKIVHWESTAAGYSPAAGYIPEVAHYYVPYDAKTANNMKLSSDKQVVDGKVEVTTEFVVDLNGKTWTRKGTDGYAGSGLLSVDLENTAIITDYSKAQTGKIVAENGIEYQKTYTGLLHVQKGATLIIEKGTIDASGAICTNQAANGGAISVGGTLIVNGGTIKGFKENTNANWGGTAIGSWGGTQIIINGGTIIGGKATNMGGTISANGNLTINGGKIYGGTAKTGDNIRMGNGDLVITGGEIDGGIQVVAGTKSVTLSGKPVIKAGTNYALKLGGVKADVSGLQAGASVYVTTSNVFTKELASEAAAQALVNNGALKTADEGMMIKVEGKAIACVSDGTTRTWMDATKLPDMGNWKLGVDVITTATTTLSGELFLDLNGHTVTHNATSIVIETGANKLTIDDLSGKTGDELGRIVISAAEGAFKGGAVYVGGNGEFVLNNGVLDASNVKTTYTGANAGTITIGNGKIGETPIYGKATINGGKVLGWKSVGNGSAIGMMSKTTLVINGGEVVGNEVSKHATIGATGNGGTITAAGYLTINGGKIYGGTAEGSGDNIDMSHASATLTITGGEIDGGIASRAHDSITLSGAPKINEGANYGLKLGTGKTVDATGLTGGEIYVDASGVFTTDFTNATAAEAAMAWLKSGIVGQDVSLEGNALKVGAAGLPAKGSYKLTTDMTLNDTLVLTGDLVIDLNGYTITSSVAPAIQTGGKNLVITDTSGKTGDQLGKITTTTISGSKSAGVIYANGSAGTVTIENGIIDGSNVTTTYTAANAGTITVSKNLIVNGGKIIGWKSSGNGGAIGSWGNTQITINGGEIVGGTITKSINGTGYGGAIAANGNLTIAGGKISGGSAQIGGDNIWVNNANAVVTISGGEIDGGVQLNNFHNSSKISGTVTIKEGAKYGLKLASGKMIDMTGLTGGEIYVDCTGVFTTNFTDATAANAALSFLKSGESGKSLKVEGTAIKMATDVEVTLSKTELTLVEGKDETITATKNPAEATITWTSSNEAVATVVDGKITAVSVGTATITVTAEHGGVQATKTCTVTVKSATADLTDEPWTEWTKDNALPTAGKYKLTKPVNISSAVALTGELWLDLNGYTVTRNVSTASNQFAIQLNGYKMVIDDLSGKTGDELGCIKTVVASGTDFTGQAGVIYANATATAGSNLILNNGIIDGSGVSSKYTTANSGAITVGSATEYGATFTMNGGVIKGQRGTTGTGSGSGKSGSCIGGHSKTTITINGGTIIAPTSTSNTDYICVTGTIISTKGDIYINGGEMYASYAMNHGGAIYHEGTNLIMTGGKIVGGRSTNSGAICSSGTTVTITGGSIIGGKANNNPGRGASVDKNNGTLTIGGNAVVAGGIGIRGSANLIFTGTPVIDSRIGAEQKFDVLVGAATAKVYLDSTSGTQLTVANGGKYKVTYDNNGKVNGLATYTVPTITESATLPTTGAVKLTDDVTLTEALVTTGDLYIDLNGHTVTNTGSTYAIKAAHNVVITDTSAEKTGKIVTSTASITSDAAILYVMQGKKAVLLNGTLDGSAVTNGFASSYAGTVTVGNYASFVMFDGEVKGQISSSTGSTGKGGSCIGGWNNSKTIIYGGKLTAASKGTTFSTHAVAAQGTCISSGGDVFVHGGELHGSMATNHGANIYCTANLTITGGLISGGYSNNSGLISCSGNSLTITGGTLVGGTAHSSSGLGGASIDYAKSGGILTIGGNAKVAGGVSIRDGSKLVLTGKAVVDMNMAGQTQKRFNIQIKKGTCSIYLNEATGTAIATASSGTWDVNYDVNGSISGITQK